MRATQEATRKYLVEECFAMIKYLSTAGREIPELASLLIKSEHADTKGIDIGPEDLIRLNNELSKRVSPARPNSIWLLYKEAQRKSILSFLGPVNLVKRLMLMALTSLIAFIAISLSPQINHESIDNTIFDKWGFELAIILAFYITSASLGAAFSNLFQANKHILNDSFDPKYETSYWIRYVMGVIAGFLLAVVIPLPAEFADTNDSNLEVFSRPLLAMLGGFSSALVYRILFRLVYAVESVFVGKQSEQAEKEIAGMKTLNEIDKQNEKQKIVSELLALQGEVSQGKTAYELRENIQQAITKLNG